MCVRRAGLAVVLTNPHLSSLRCAWGELVSLWCWRPHTCHPCDVREASWSRCGVDDPIPVSTAMCVRRAGLAVVLILIQIIPVSYGVSSGTTSSSGTHTLHPHTLPLTPAPTHLSSHNRPPPCHTRPHTSTITHIHPLTPTLIHSP